MFDKKYKFALWINKIDEKAMYEFKFFIYLMNK